MHNNSTAHKQLTMIIIEIPIINLAPLFASYTSSVRRELSIDTVFGFALASYMIKVEDPPNQATVKKGSMKSRLKRMFFRVQRWEESVDPPSSGAPDFGIVVGGLQLLQEGTKGTHTHSLELLTLTLWVKFLALHLFFCFPSPRPTWFTAYSGQWRRQPFFFF